MVAFHPLQVVPNNLTKDRLRNSLDHSRDARPLPKLLLSPHREPQRRHLYHLVRDKLQAEHRDQLLNEHFPRLSRFIIYARIEIITRYVSSCSSASINFHKLITVFTANFQVILLFNSTLTNKVTLLVIVFIAITQTRNFFLRNF